MRQRARVLRVSCLLAGLAVLALSGPAMASSHEAIEQAELVTTETADPGIPFQAFDAVTRAVVDLDGDGDREIVAHNDNNRAYVFDGASGALLGELTTNHPEGWTARELGGPAVGDLTGNGVRDIVLANSAGWVTAFEARPTGQPDQPLAFERSWETLLDPSREDPEREQVQPSMDGGPFLADVEAGAGHEVFAQLDDVLGMYKLGSEGNVSGWKGFSEGNAGPIVADLTDDGRREAVYPSDGGDVFVFDAETMEWQCGFEAEDHGVQPGSISVTPTLADLTGDGRLEIVFGARNVVDDRQEGWMDRSNAHHFALDADCEVVWQRSWRWSNPHVHMHPVPVDVTGNGHLDVVFQDWNTIGHKPGDWNLTGASNLFAVEGHSGQLLWRVEVPNTWSNKNLAVGDVTGDGEPEILANTYDEVDGIGLYTLAGERTGFVPSPEGWMASKGATIADLDGDGRQQLVLPVHRGADFCDRELDVGCRAGALAIYDTPSTNKPVYANSHTRTTADATHYPQAEGQARNATPFTASLSEIHGSNRWIEVRVDAERSIASVDVRVDASPWASMGQTEAGTWARAQPLPNGSIVQLQAKDAQGHPWLSQCYAWPEVEPTRCPGQRLEPQPPPEEDERSIAFRQPGGNAWWVEIDVATNRSIEAVQFRVGEEDWRGMARTGWGTWARATEVAEGSPVQFRAQTPRADATSACFAWPSVSQVPCPGEGSWIGEVHGNRWWIEVDTDTEQPVSAVQARVEGGEWRSMAQTPWGTWALNAEVPEDARVDLRAEAGPRSVLPTQTYAWPPP